MPNSYYNHTTFPATSAPGSSALARAEFDAVTNGFALLPTLTGNAGKIVQVDATGTSLVASSAIQVDAASQVGVGMAPVASAGALQFAGNISAGTATWALGYALASQTASIAGATSPYYGVNMATFTGFGGLGLGMHGNGGLLFSTAAVERMRISSTGLVTMQNGLTVTGSTTTSTAFSVGTDQVLPTNGYNISAPSYGGAIELRGNGVTANRGWRIGLRDNGTGFTPHLSYLDSTPNTIGVNSTFVVNPSNGSEAIHITNSAGYIAGYDTGNTTRTGYLQFNAGANVSLNAENGSFLTFQTATLERMRIDTTGNVGIGVAAFGTSAAKVLGLANATAPSTSPAGMGQMYVEAGALKYRGSAGTVTVLGPA